MCVCVLHVLFTFSVKVMYVQYECIRTWRESVFVY